MLEKDFLEENAVFLTSRTNYRDFSRSKYVSLKNYLQHLPSDADGCYSMSKDIILVIENEHVYLLVSSDLTLEYVQSHWTQEYFQLPFTSKFIQFEAKALNKKWNNLIKAAELSHTKAMLKEVDRYCQKHKIGNVDSEILEKYCFEIPFDGVLLINPNMDVRHNSYTVFNPWALEELNFCFFVGKYATDHKGTTIFHTRSGKTFITNKGEHVIPILRYNNFQENTNLKVPAISGLAPKSGTLYAAFEKAFK